ncbi:MAG: hypothetical protein EXR81_00555 [Gammaproteobacteria bacterium]|nr:hypothetical protein [Gammaproteobacteria bacterium]
MATHHKTDFNDLTLHTVLQLYEQKLKIDARNDIKGRTHLLQIYPELFDENIWEEVAETCEMVRCAERKQMIGRKIGVMLL